MAVACNFRIKSIVTVCANLVGRIAFDSSDQTVSHFDDDARVVDGSVAIKEDLITFLRIRSPTSGTLKKFSGELAPCSGRLLRLTEHIKRLLFSELMKKTIVHKDVTPSGALLFTIVKIGIVSIYLRRVLGDIIALFFITNLRSCE